MAYKSPIELICDDIQYDVEQAYGQAIIRVVQHYFPLMDEEELEKALRYDRNQYAAGFIDGRAARDAEIVRCKDCALWNDGKCDTWSALGVTVLTAETGYCNFGERRDDG